ncbi:hypothetical protein SAMN05428949_4668 [Chitinophaga sp. YR627]|uniref:hypothetical protein n=1 Tax=Chitinophaga sp. YR627 TaxID=1881041 RepID=UPI0008E47543|nr:hypothetical protein [Chitinophaga sp. YR627]SFO25330.1 hypothetical protein SAMN05428949_4668 [Chitinophaga sp. YR627]
MKGPIAAVLCLSLLFSAITASAQFVKTKDLEKMKKRTRIIVLKEKPDKKILKQLARTSPEMANAYKQAIRQLNQDFPEAVRQFWTVNSGATIEVRTEKEIEKIRKKSDRTSIVMDCQSLHVKPGVKSRYSKLTRTYTSGLSWQKDPKDLSIPVISMTFIESDLQYPFYIQNMSDQFPDYIDLAVGLRLATFVFNEQLEGKTSTVLQKEIKHNAVLMKGKTLVLCKDWLDETFEANVAKNDYPFPIKYVSLEELENLIRKDVYDSTVVAYVPAGVFSTFDKNAPSMEVHVPVVFDPANGMPLCHSDISHEMFQAWGFSLIPRMGKTVVGFKKIRNEDIRHFAKSITEGEEQEQMGLNN